MWQHFAESEASALSWTNARAGFSRCGQSDVCAASKHKMQSDLAVSLMECEVRCDMADQQLLSFGRKKAPGCACWPCSCCHGAARPKTPEPETLKAAGLEGSKGTWMRRLASPRPQYSCSMCSSFTPSRQGCRSTPMASCSGGAASVTIAVLTGQMTPDVLHSINLARLWLHRQASGMAATPP